MARWSESESLTRDGQPRQGLPHFLDVLMANAWRPLEEERQGEWRYRWTEGVTGRANSVLAIGGEGDLDRLVERGESFYAERAAPARFLVSDASAPATLSGYLAARGYQPEKLTLMMTADSAEVASRAGSGPWDLSVAVAVSDEWFDCYWSVEAERGRTPRDALVYRDVLLATDRPQRFVAVVAGGVVVGTGQAVFEAGWGGVQCMTTRTAFRGQGAASAVLATLASEAAQAGVEHLYLAVQSDNQRAISLYRRSGFRPTHPYQYWRQKDLNVVLAQPDDGPPPSR
jgi:ribosomal protein S18 acetylase RimI-like enzyme